MTPRLQDLLTTMRQHPAFRELLDHIKPPETKNFKPSQPGDGQFHEWIYRSGRLAQHAAWTDFLTEGQSPQGEIISHKERS